MPLLTKLFKAEGNLAYKNIKRNAIKYRMIVISISMSITVFAVTNGLFANMYKNIRDEGKYTNYTIDIKKENMDKIISALEEKQLINDYMGIENTYSCKLEIPNEKVTNEIKEMIYASGNRYNASIQPNGNLIINATPFMIYGNAYKEILKRAGVNELKENEAILVNCVYMPDSKWGDEIPITNYKVGDTLELTDDSGLEPKTINLKIAGIVDNIQPYMVSDSLYMDIIISEDMVKEYEEEESSPTPSVLLTLDTDKPNEIDEIVGGLDTWQSVNKYEYKLSDISKKAIIEIAVYTFIIFITLLTIINIFNIIFSNIMIRKKEIAILRSIGMNKKQINKMLFLEGLFYGVKGLIIGILFSIWFLFIIYLKMIDAKIYKFSVSYINIIICVAIMYLIIFMAIAIAGKSIKNRNIMEDVKDENI